MSQISSHFIVMYHRRIVKEGQRKYQERHHPERLSDVVIEETDPAPLLASETSDHEKKDLLCKHRFMQKFDNESERVVARRSVNFSFPVAAMMLSALLVVSCTLPSLRIEVYGVVGIFIEIGKYLKEEAVKKESIFSMAAAMVEQAVYMEETVHYIGNIFLTIVFIATLLVVPIAMLATMTYMWLFPQTRKTRERVAIAIETLQAWQYVEVYILGIIIESWQLGQVSRLFLNTYCDDLNPLLESLAFYGVIATNDAQCMEVEASIGFGAFLLIPFVFGLASVGSFVIKAYTQYLRQKHDDEVDTSEMDKLRAFDRTTWDDRDEAATIIQKPPIGFTDTFKWALRAAGVGDNSTVASHPEVLSLEESEMYAGTGSSDHPNDAPVDFANTITYPDNHSSTSSGDGSALGETRELLPADEPDSSDTIIET